MFAIIEAHKAGLLKLKNWPSNIVAGLIVGVVALPLAMAFAIASGAEPVQGLYTAIVAAFFVAIFGGSRVQIAGPTGAFIVILAGITAHYGIVGLQIASMMAGIILLLMGLLRLGAVMEHIPESVIVGFTAGIGVIIFVGEWKDFFGLPIKLPIDMHFYEKIIVLLQSFSHINFATTAMAIFALLLTIFSTKIIKRVPGPLVAMLIPTVLQMIFHFPIPTLGSVFGEIPRQLPSFHLPAIQLSVFPALIGPAISIALLGAIESLLSAAAADKLANTEHHSNRELIGQGLANIFTPLFGGFAATGAIARTATNVRNGGNSPIAAIVHSLVLIFVLLVLSPFTAYTPLCALAAILFVIAFHMSNIPRFMAILKNTAKKDEAIILLSSFLLTVFTNLVIAVCVGVILAFCCEKWMRISAENEA